MKEIQPFRRPSETATRSYRTHMRSSPVFVVGGARSGTSILAILLRKYLGISFGTESQFFIRFFNRLQNYGDLNNNDNLKKLLADISRERCFQRWRKWDYILDVDKIHARIRENSYTGIIDAIFNDLADHNQMNRWGDKTPEYIYNLPVLHTLFPEAKFIHILRDGRDVALSTFKTHFGAKNIGIAALEWNQQLACVAKFKKMIDPGKFCEIRYEDLLDDPVGTFKKLMNFLNIVDIDGTILRRIETEMAGELYPGNYYKWRNELTKKEQNIFERVNYQHLVDSGYPTITNSRKNASSFEKACWKIDHRIRQLSRIDTWKDNFYKLQIRFRQLLFSDYPRE